ncbi:hypothetical protein [Azospirillum sp. sgz302134]
MPRTALLSGFAALALLSGTAAAQDAGGFSVDPRLGATVGMSMGMGMGMPPLLPRQPVFVNAGPRGAPPGATVTNPAVSRKQVHQQAIAKIRGDAGFLGGFNKGQALAASRQPPPEPVVPVFPTFNFIDAPFTVNNVDSSLSLTFGDGNVSSQGVLQNTEISGNPGGGAPQAQAPPQGPSATAPAQAHAPAPPPKPVPVAAPKPSGNKGSFPFGGDIDPVMSNFGPLPHLPAALANGGVQFNNVNSTFNAAIGQGNVASQQVISIQKLGKK